MKFFLQIHILETGLRSRIMAKRSKLTENSKQKRVQMAQENVHFSIYIWILSSVWILISVFIDETNFQTGPNGQMRVRRFNNTRFYEQNLLEVQIPSNSI